MDQTFSRSVPPQLVLAASHRQETGDGIKQVLTAGSEARVKNLIRTESPSESERDSSSHLLISILMHSTCEQVLHVYNSSGCRRTDSRSSAAIDASDVCELEVDTNTVNKQLKLSDNNRKVMRVRKLQPYPNHQDRFDVCPQLLCTTGLTGRCYWEVEWSGDVSVSVSYRGISRKGGGRDCELGRNDQSWSLYCSDDDGLTAYHNNRKTRLFSSQHPPSRSYILLYLLNIFLAYSSFWLCPLLFMTHYTVPLLVVLVHIFFLLLHLPLPSSSFFSSLFSSRSIPSSSSSSSSSVLNRVAVYVDCPAGTLSFFRVSSDKLIHLFTFNTSFTEPVYPAFRLWPGSSVSLQVRESL